MTTLPKVSLTDYAPGGVLRIALNHGNRVLLDRDSAGNPVGISVDLGHALAAELQTQARFIEFQRAGDVAAAAGDDVWDVCFLAADPVRAEVIDFSQPYIRIEGCYLMRKGGLASTPEEVFQHGLTIGSVQGSAYSLHLARQPGAEKLRLFRSMADAVAAMDARQVDGLAGIRKAMDEIAELCPDARLVQPPFMEIRQSMGVVAGRSAAISHLRHFLGRLAENGTTQTILVRNGVDRRCAILVDVIPN